MQNEPLRLCVKTIPLPIEQIFRKTPTVIPS